MANVLTKDFKWIKAKTQEAFDLDVSRGLRLETTTYQLGRHLKLGVYRGIGIEEEWAGYDICGVVEFDDVYMAATKTIAKVMLGDDILWTNTPMPLQRALDTLPEADEMWLDFLRLETGRMNRIPLSQLGNCEDLYVIEFTEEDRKTLIEEGTEALDTLSLIYRDANGLLKWL